MLNMNNIFFCLFILDSFKRRWICSTFQNDLHRLRFEARLETEGIKKTCQTILKAFLCFFRVCFRAIALSIYFSLCVYINVSNYSRFDKENNNKNYELKLVYVSYDMSYVIKRIVLKEYASRNEGYLDA